MLLTLIYTSLDIKWIATIIYINILYRDVCKISALIIIIISCYLCVLCSSTVMIREEENSCIHEC